MDEGEGAGSAAAGSPGPGNRRKHYRCLITKDLIDEYKSRGGARIVLSFVEMPGNKVGLVFTGFDKDKSPCMTCFLDHDENHPFDSKNQFFGIIFSDDQGVLLHDLFASGPAKDWTLDPEPYDKMEDYVSYRLLEGQGLVAASKLNPSPPA